MYPSLSVISLHKSTLPHNVKCTDSPLAAPVVTSVEETASGHARVRVINCAMRAKGHYGRRVWVRRHTTPNVKTPLDALHRLGECVMAERALPREGAAGCSRTSVENRPFLCRPSMGRTSLHGEFCGGTGHQGVSQLHSWGPAADCTSPNAVLWGMEAQLCINGVDGKDAETGLFTPVLQHPSSIHRHKRGKAIIPRGDRFPLGRNRQCLLCALKTERKGTIPCTSWFPRRQENSGPFWIFTA